MSKARFCLFVLFFENYCWDTSLDFYKIDLKLKKWFITVIGNSLPHWISLDRLGLPLFTILVGLVYGFNPCAMLVLVFLLSMLVHVKSRKRMFAISAVFVLISGFVYFTFMAAWLNIFQAIGLSTPIRWIVGSIGLLTALFYIRDFIWGFSSTSLISLCVLLE